MNTSKHTSGPWSVNPTGDVGPWIVGTHSDFIADCSTSNVSDEEIAANAKLIAASPTLLTMLSRLMDEIMMSEDCFRHIAPLTLEQARNAIAQATEAL